MIKIRLNTVWNITFEETAKNFKTRKIIGPFYAVRRYRTKRFSPWIIVNINKFEKPIDK